MIKLIRSLVMVLAVLALPVATLADPATTAPTATGDSSALQATGQTDASKQSSNLLQPAASSGDSLQSASASGAGVGQSTVQNLQQSGNSSQVELMIQGDGDAPHSVANHPSFSWLLYLLAVLAVATAATAAASWRQTRRI